MKRILSNKEYKSLHHKYKQEQERFDTLTHALSTESQSVKSRIYGNVNQLPNAKINFPTLYKRYQDCRDSKNRIVAALAQCKDTLNHLSESILCYRYPFLTPVFKAARYLINTATRLYGSITAWCNDKLEKTKKVVFKKDTVKTCALGALTTGVIAAFSCLSIAMKTPWLMASAEVYSYMFFASVSTCIALLGLLTLIKIHRVLYPDQKQKQQHKSVTPKRAEKKKVLLRNKVARVKRLCVSTGQTIPSKMLQSCKINKAAFKKQKSKEKASDTNQIILKQSNPTSPCATQALYLSTFGFFCSTMAMYTLSLGNIKILRYQEMITS